MSAISDVRKNRTAGDIGFATNSGTISTDLVAAVSGRKIRVLAMCYSQASATSLKFQTNATTDLTGAFTTSAANLNGNLPFNPFGWFQTALGEKLNYVPATAVATHVSVTYVLI
jgi:hypothetical protein